MKIVELDGYGLNPGDLSWGAISKLGELKLYDRTSQEDVVSRAKEADVILINKVNITDEIMGQLPKLKYIGVLATGYNVVDIEAASRRGILVSNIPAYSTDSVAQMTFAHILNMVNRVEHYADLNRKGRWSNNPDFCYWDTPLMEISGKTIGILGLGSIGSKVARIAQDFGMDVYAFTSKSSSDLPVGIQKTTIDGLLSVSDILTLHCPLTSETRELINKESLKKMKHGALLINTGRGQLVNEQDVAEALNSGQLGGYGADVMCEEPPLADNPLFAQPNAFITPHVAWATIEARTRLMNILEENLKSYIDGSPNNIVNKTK
ncbi:MULTISPECIES: D-2-hydroxyacid dehydrogenase [Prevotella]|uniref:Glycerate dehydrogenase n=1 Tax=Prevotella herbatica TaxID=2801997 RepID=A0ABM7NUN4_9BACT|nr:MULTISPECIES: D-2-hydroxyacid dehydrogenase [Prevotella]MDN5553167.1 D-2-hydroxyacid dehydrogenase [Prevotella sp.]BCS84208.1 glycerate dehydrogenase [Prevotella herbatica]